MSEEYEEPASPCIKICLMDDEGYCLGCRRTLEEIAQWRDFNDAEKRALLAQLGDRHSTPEIGDA